ncbi:hypothetical protein WDW37_15050 [Bdellovibrionota bacterium FG-1]
MTNDDPQDSKSDKNILERLIGGIREVADPADHDKLHEKVAELKESEKRVAEKKHPSAAPPVGLDIGTSRIVSLTRDAGGEIVPKDQLNAFFTIPQSLFAAQMLEKSGMKFAEIEGKQLAIYGYDAQQFSNIFNGEVRRPMSQGLLKASEPLAIQMIKLIIGLVVEKSKTFGTSLCFGVPAPQIGFESDLIFHESILKKYLVGMGYNTKSITEGAAVVLSELSEDNYTGIGISMGGGMCNVCFSFLSVPVIVFSIPKGGDYIDSSVARVVNETQSRVRVIKEESLDFGRPPRNKVEQAFEIYYDDLIMSLLTQLSAVFSQSQHLPKLSQAIPVVLAGGTSMPNGFRQKFDKAIRQANLPIQISEVRLSADPLRSTGRGALINAGA